MHELGVVFHIIDDLKAVASDMMFQAYLKLQLSLAKYQEL